MTDKQMMPGFTKEAIRNLTSQIEITNDIVNGKRDGGLN